MRLNSSFDNTPKKTAKSIPTVDIPSLFHIHPSKPCRSHDSICRHDENAASARVVPKIPTNVSQFVRAFHLQLLLLPLGGSRQILQTLQRASSKHVGKVAFQLSIHLCQSGRNRSHLMSSLVFTSTWNVTRRSFPDSLPEQNFIVRVCLFTQRMADSPTPLVAASPTRLSRKNHSTRQMELPTKSHF